MSLINNVAAILNNNKDIDDVYYLNNKIDYNDNISTLNIDIKSILPSPPKNSSGVTEKELKEVAKATKSRTHKELKLIYTVDQEPLELFYNFLDKYKLSFPQELFEEHYNVLEEYVYALKYYHNRARPSQIAPYYNITIDEIITETHHTPSYPSGHTMYSELAAHILSDIYPEFRSEFFRLSDYCGLARILQGVHYPSDNKAARIAVNKLYPLMKERQDEQSQNIPFDIQSKT